MMSKRSSDELDDFEFIDYEEPVRRTQKKKSGTKKGKKKRKRSILEKLVIAAESVVAILFACVIVVYATPNMTEKLVNSPFGKYFAGFIVDKEGYQKIFDSNYSKDDITTNDELDMSILDGYMNIALLGLDNGSAKERTEGGDSCDCIMILSINKETSDVKLCSIYRDTYLRIINGNGSIRQIGYQGNTTNYYKVNATYGTNGVAGENIGGAAAVVNTLNTNLDLNIQDYVMVNFNGIATIIDMLGGIEVNLTREEMDYVNGYLTETRKITGIKADDLDEYGENIHLNGLQATAYSRIRYTPIYFEDGTSLNWDYGRAARQRSVIMKMVAKAKDAGVDAVLKMCDEIFQSESDIFKTSIPYEDAIKLIPIVLNFSFGDTAAFPFTLTTSGDLGITVAGGSSVIPCGLDYNVIQLHKYLFPEEIYSPSDTVVDISEEIYKKTGAETVRIEDYAGDNTLE